MSLPSHGRPREEVLAALGAYRRHDVPWREGRLYAGLYDPGAEAEETVRAAYAMFLSENALYPNYFPSLLQIEREVVRTLAELLRGDERVVGNCTSGGTESIMLAVKAARDKFRAERPELTAPELVLPRTAHPAFHKAAHYLGLRPVLVEVDAGSFQADPAAYAAAITPQTIMLVASAPCYSHGVIDPVGAIAGLAAERGLLCHVDACVGGLLLSVMRRMGEPLPDFDFSLPGVSSISVDMHKYGYAAKNVSTVLFRDAGLRRHALFCNAATTGYAVINTTVLSSRSGGPMAGAWAALQHIGEEGYRQIARETLGSARALMAGVAGIPGLRVLGAPAMTMFAFAADDLNIFALDDAMARRGWALQPQFSAGGSPANIHVSVSRSNVGHEAALLADLREAAAEVRAAGGPADAGALRAEVERILAEPGPAAFAQIVALAGITPGRMPEGGFARINTVLDALPDAVVEALLAEYLNSLYV